MIAGAEGAHGSCLFYWANSRWFINIGTFNLVQLRL